MVKLTDIYTKPSHAQKFNRYYKDVHSPLANKMPGLKKGKRLINKKVRG